LITLQHSLEFRADQCVVGPRLGCNGHTRRGFHGLDNVDKYYHPVDRFGV
jgi:hypothetical protein